jgi:hypothetical protein
MSSDDVPGKAKGYWRGTWTNRKWRFANCRSFCLDYPGSIESITMCPDKNGSFFRDNGMDYYDACTSGVGLPVFGKVVKDADMNQYPG